MLERLVAFGIVVAALFGLAAYLRDDGPSPADACLDGPACGEAPPQEPVAPACPDGCAPARPAAPRPAPSRLLPWDEEREDKEDKDDDDEEEREEKGDREKRRGKRGKD